MEFFHLGALRLGVGSVIMPGNWGRLLRHHGCAHKLFSRERILEEVRLASFPSKPSRLGAIFGCESLEDIRTFRMRTNRLSDVVYKVVPVTEEYSAHRGDWDAVSIIPGLNDTQIDAAHYYWSSQAVPRVDGEMSGNFELIVDCPVKVVEEIEVPGLH